MILQHLGLKQLKMTKLNMRMSTLLKKFTKDHEWVLINESKNEAEIGITNFASNQLGQVVFIEMPEENKSFGKGESVGQLESVKSVGSIVLPFDATVLETNKDVLDDTSLLSDTTSNDTWLLRVKFTTGLDLNELMTDEQYQKYLTTL